MAASTQISDVRRWCMVAAATIAAAVCCAVTAAEAEGARPGYRTVLFCGEQSGSVGFHVAPRSCIFLFDLSRGVVGHNVLPVTEIRWRRWGRSTAFGIGRYTGRDQDVKVRIRLFRRIGCGNANYNRASGAYTRIELRGSGTLSFRSSLQAPLPEFC